MAAEGDGLTPQTAFYPLRSMVSVPTQIKAFSVVSTGSETHIIHTPTTGNSIELFAIQLTATTNLSYSIKEGGVEIIPLESVGVWSKDFPAPYTYVLDINEALSIEVTGIGTTKGWIHYREVSS